MGVKEFFTGYGIAAPLMIVLGLLFAVFVPEAQMTSNLTPDRFIVMVAVAGFLFWMVVDYLRRFMNQYTDFREIPGKTLGVLVVIFLLTWIWVPEEFAGLTLLMLTICAGYVLMPKRAFDYLGGSVWIMALTYVLATGRTQVEINIMPPPDSGFVAIISAVSGAFGEIVRSFFNTFQWTIQAPVVSGQGVVGSCWICQVIIYALIGFAMYGLLVAYITYREKIFEILDIIHLDGLFKIVANTVERIYNDWRLTVIAIIAIAVIISKIL